MKTQQTQTTSTLSIEEIERLSLEEWDRLPEDTKEAYYDYLRRENSPTPQEFYGYDEEWLDRRPLKPKVTTWVVSEVTSPDELAEKLTTYIRDEGTGFKLGNLLFLNDIESTGAGAQEYDIILEYPNGKYLLIDSIIFGLIEEYERALEIIRNLHRDAPLIMQGIVKPRLSIETTRSIELEKGHC